MTTWNDILISWKKSETAEPVIALIEDDQIRKVLWAYKISNVCWNPKQNPSNDNDHEAWEKAWEFTVYDPIEIGTISGIRNQVVNYLMDRIKMTRLAYPDGSINSHADKYIKAYISKRIKEGIRT